MTRARLSYGLITSQNQGGGDSKQGLVSRVGKSGVNFRVISRRSTPTEVKEEEEEEEAYIHFVAVARDFGSIGNQRVMTSPDGITWKARTAANANGWNSVTYGGGRFVAVAFANAVGQQVMTSPDGINWTDKYQRRNLDTSDRGEYE